MPRHMWKHAFAGLIGFLTVCCVPVFGDKPGDSALRLLDDVKHLASDELEGRGVGSKGLLQAADYVRQEFANAGLNVKTVDGDAFQTFKLVTRAEMDEPNSLRFVGPDEKTIELKQGVDFRPCSFGGAAEFSGEVVFCGYAIDDKQYNDFEGIDLKDRIAIVMRRNPQQANEHGPFTVGHGRISRHADLRTKTSNAFGRGAKAILFVSDPYTSQQTIEQAEQAIEKAADAVVKAAEEFAALDEDAGDDARAAAEKKLTEAVDKLKARRNAREKLNSDPLMSFGHGGNGKDGSPPILHITQEACDRLLKATLDKSLKDLEAEIDAELKPHSTPLADWTVAGETNVKRVREEVKNVIGVLEGEGPLADETIVIGAHYDHVGRGEFGSLAKPENRNEIHNGADDNASGTAALIELAHRLAARQEKLPRRLVFIAFTAEERGLIGSARYVNEPVFPLEKTVAMFNMDMVGRLQNDKLTVFGTGTSPRWKGLVEEFGKENGFDLALRPAGQGPSDHTSFYNKKIPVLHFFTGSHSDYHRPSDDWDKINTEGMARVVDLLEDLVVATATTDERPKYVATASQPANRGGSRPYFGSIPDFGSDQPGYSITAVAEDSPAAKGGLKGGDVIVRLGRMQIGDLNDFDLALRKFKPGDEVPVVVQRDGEEVTLKVTLEKPR